MAAITMNFSTISTILAKDAVKGFVLGGVYAFFTNGPILISGTACAISALFTNTIDLLLLQLHQDQHLTSNTVRVLSYASHILAPIALIVAGIAYGIIGPVGIGVLVLGTLYNLKTVDNIFP
jgi:hypothetical protein